MGGPLGGERALCPPRSGPLYAPWKTAVVHFRTGKSYYVRAGCDGCYDLCCDPNLPKASDGPRSTDFWDPDLVHAAFVQFLQKAFESRGMDPDAALMDVDQDLDEMHRIAPPSNHWKLEQGAGWIHLDKNCKQVGRDRIINCSSSSADDSSKP